ncbi:MAG: hypothetical protein GQ570_07160 [Helicobacteraceae bacterium]|nr:hypothetical protein [Helicobacteraceae bacterium]
MFKFVFKSTLYYYLVKKYKSKIISTIFFILLLLVTTLLYSDIVEYLALNNLKEEVLYLLLLKWSIYALSSYKIYSNLKSIFIGDSDDDKEFKKQVSSDEKYIDEVINEKINYKYEKIKDKPILKSRKESIYANEEYKL